jgi:hypothetical protein
MSSVEGGALSLRDLQRQLAALLPDARTAGGESTLEMVSQRNDAPRLTSATVLEEGILRARRIPDAQPTSAFRAFIDGTQRSSIAKYVGNVALVHGQVAAVVRERRDRRLITWGEPLVESRIYAPRAYLSSVTWNTLAAACGEKLVDITEGAAELDVHPFALRDITVQLVQSHRDQLERRLAERWCSEESDPVFIDGGISGSATVAASELAVGVVKSHFTLYVKGDALETVLSLEASERSSVFRIESSTRPTVASWYLRLRDPQGHDPMWGLVRVEVCCPDARRMQTLSERADEISRWVLAEVSPLALPDSRWDKMVYGVRDCEEFLRAVQ